MYACEYVNTGGLKMMMYEERGYDSRLHGK